MSSIVRFIYISVLFIAFSETGFTQPSFNDLVDSTLVIERDVRLDSLVMRHTRVNKLKDGFDGFRVQLFSGSGTEARLQANNLRAEFMTIYPDVPAYLVYQAPNFKVRVGDFRTELEAIRLQRELAYQYPGGFVSRDLVKFPKLAIEKEIGDVEMELPENEMAPKK
jgi:hypothetical protein